MKTCEICGKEFESGNQYCSRSCYQKAYYIKNKSKRAKYFQEKHKKQYIHKGRPPKMTEEEKKEKRHQYYQNNLEYFRNKSHEYYENHKKDPHYKNRCRKNLYNYLEKRKNNENNIEQN